MARVSNLPLRRWLYCAVGVTLAFPLTAFAQDEHGGHHGETHLTDVISPNNHEFWGSVLNFLLLIAALMWLGKKPLTQFLENRRAQVAENLAEAQRLKAEAEERYTEYTERLEKLDRELEKIRAEMVKAGEAERDRIVAEAEAKAHRMRREADFLIEQQMKQLRVDLTREAVDAAVAAAEDVLKSKTSSSDQERLAREYLDRLKSEATSAGGTA